ncbi:MAG: phospholipase [Bacteroidaceae bacterium]|nr:phospholipase [Bacteroidaceae bacterium]
MYVSSECCGMHTFCEKTGQFNGPTAENYFEDEELDRFKGRSSDSYSDEEIAEFREVLYTMRLDEVSDWLSSLLIREVNLPDSLKDEAIILLEEQSQ